MNLSINKIKKKKFQRPIICLTAYTTPIAKIVDKFSDIVLVGDSVGMVLHGFKSTRNVSLDIMIMHGIAVRKGIKNSILVVDMPFKTYESSKNIALKNAKLIIKKTRCDAVKVEGGVKIFNVIKYLVDNGVSVMGHVGLLPQSSKKYKVQGKSEVSYKKVLNDAIAVEKAGAFSVIVECVSLNLANKINKTVTIPTIGIGASNTCDGQVLVTEDLLGMNREVPRFVKKYEDLDLKIQQAIKKFSYDVKNKIFPSKSYLYK